MPTASIIFDFLTPSGPTIDGGPDVDLATQYEVLILVSDGTNWFVISQEVP